jgi:hypothetical protein
VILIVNTINKVMIKSILLAIGLIAMTAIIATSGIAIQSAQARIEPVPGNGGGGCPVGGCIPAPPVPP